MVNAVAGFLPVDEVASALETTPRAVQRLIAR